jgi:hypothetical protein
LGIHVVTDRFEASSALVVTVTEATEEVSVKEIRAGVDRSRCQLLHSWPLVVRPPLITAIAGAAAGVREGQAHTSKEHHLLPAAALSNVADSGWVLQRSEARTDVSVSEKAWTPWRQRESVG